MFYNKITSTLIFYDLSGLALSFGQHRSEALIIGQRGQYHDYVFCKSPSSSSSSHQRKYSKM